MNVKFVGGMLCLDFVNTVGARVRPPARARSREYADVVLREKLANFNDFLNWGELAGVLQTLDVRRLTKIAARREKYAALVLERGRKLREALYRIFKCAIENWEPESTDLEIFTRELLLARNQERFMRSGGAFQWTVRDAPEALDRVLWLIAKSAGELLTSPKDLEHLRQCEGAECGWLFLDTSRNHSRQWCSMTDCGNLAKVRRFRERQRGTRA